MQEIQYIGEHLLPGRLGHFAVILAFIAAMVSAIGYYYATQKHNLPERDGWLKLGRAGFSVHALAVLWVIGSIFYIMLNQYYEYEYAWAHVSDQLPMRYIFSAFWEGQEGSFLLWMFWHLVLGMVLMFKAGRWEAPVLAVLALVEVWLISMLLGFHFGEGFKLGSSPFLLLRDTMAAPIFSNAEYVELIEGTGLNALLQNYWMTIHPPTLFLGFASTTVPFCYAIAGLWTGDHKGWMAPALKWALFSAGILGIGIMMGGAWAYEALSFGGYWAWDPVENMSLVPWIILIAGIHGNLIARSTGYSIRATYLFYMLTFLLVLYSTFLTRSGILGDTSVHAFTQMGLEWQLVCFILFFAALGFVPLLRLYKKIPAPKQEESISSREFWMFIGMLVLFFSALLISFTTSIPVYNKIFDLVGWLTNNNLEGLHRTAPVDPEAHYNRYQLWIAVFIAILSAIAQYLRYRESRWQSYRNRFIKHVAISSFFTAILGILLLQWINAIAWQYILLVFAAAFAVVANLEYLLITLRGNLKLGASALAHFGFGVMLIGIMASGLNKRIISSNPFAQAGLIDDMDPRRNITLIKDRPMFMNGYWVHYKQDTFDRLTREFEIAFARVNEQLDTVEQFTVRPSTLYNLAMTKVESSNPSTKHYLHRDIFSFVSGLPAEQMDIEAGQAVEDSLKYLQYQVSIGDTIETEKSIVLVEGITMSPVHPDLRIQPGDVALGLHVRARLKSSNEWHESTPALNLRQALAYRYPVQINDLNMRIRLPDEAIYSILSPEQELNFESYKMSEGGSVEISGTHFRLLGLDRNASHPDYVAEEGDIALNALLEITRDDQSRQVRPFFLIRGNRTPYFRTFVPDFGIHVNFSSIDPQTEEFEFRIAFQEKKSEKIPLEIAENAPRDDLIVLEVIEFPGINLVWSGSILMFLGLFVGMYRKLKSRSVA